MLTENPVMRRMLWIGLALLSTELLGGCSTLFYDLQPHRLRRLNRGPAPALDPEFSAVSKPLGPAVVANSGKSVTVRAQQ
jgi:hypothetical protein